MTMKPITDRAEVAIDFPDKAYMGSFGRASSFEAGADAEGVWIKLARGGEDKRVAELHLHYYLFAGVLDDIARALAARPPLDAAHREVLEAAVRALLQAVERPPEPTSDGAAAAPSPSG